MVAHPNPQIPEFPDTFFAAGTAEGYAQNLNGAHKSPPPRIRPPAIVAHIGFWNPFSLAKLQPEEQTEDKLIELRQERWTKSDHYMADIWLRLKALEKETLKGVTRVRSSNEAATSLRLFGNYLPTTGLPLLPYRKGVDDEYDRFVQQVDIRFKWFEADVTIQFEQRREFINTIYSIDISGQISDENRSQIEKNFNPIGLFCSGLQGLNDEIISDKYESAEVFQPYFELLYRGIWDRFYDSLIKDSRQYEIPLGEIFMDFRGLVLGALQLGRSDAAFVPPHWRASRRKSATHRLSEEDVKLRRGFDISLEKEPPKDVLDKFWRFLSVKSGGVDFSNYEFTASEMLNGDVIYVTALGAQPSSNSGTRIPVYYLMYANTYNGWQIGRLAERVNYLGAVRIASMRHYDQLRAVGYVMDLCAEKLQIAKKAYVEGLKNLGPSPPEGDWQSILLAFREEVGRIRAMLSASISHHFKGDADIAGKLQLSRFYIQEFETGIADLGVIPIPQFQPYGSFVLKRLGSSFSNVRAISTRHQNLMRDLDSAEDFLFSHNSEFTELKTMNRSNDLEELGKIADLALWGALLPYYVGSIIFHYIIETDKHPEIGDVLWVTLWILCASIGVAIEARKLNRKYAPRTAKEKIWGLFGSFAIAVLIGCVVISALRLIWDHFYPALGG